ncbi:MAG TPA: M23 family metallopeptidase, partial [Candidatus Paceibacterota bacterium]|nr:M23 family metallopeptidase [Candidatus Paceibacterota bacterium]
MAALVPNRASAFWFFGVNANAAGGGFTPTASTPLLEAATNIDPNPDKGLGDGIQTSDNAVLAYTGPSGTIADVASSTPSDRISVYVVRPGDTISEIADMFGVSANTIIWANNLSSARDIHVGDTLIILPISGVKHTVAKNETLKSIARKYSADAGEIAQFNGLDASAPLAVGSTIIIPGAEVAPPAEVSIPKKSIVRGKTIREPYLGGSGAAQPGYYSNPLPGGIITQGIHGWNAVDIGAARGTPIHAAADGTIIIARNNGGWNGGYGNYVVITHGNDTQTLYAHMTHSIVSPGESVSAGQIIGYVGSTGMSTGAHLHFEVRGA